MNKEAERFLQRLNELQEKLAILEMIAQNIVANRDAGRCSRWTGMNYPAVGEKYYVPMPGKKDKVATYKWESSNDDYRLWERGLVFCRPYLAACAADLMLEAIQ